MQREGETNTAQKNVNICIRLAAGCSDDDGLWFVLKMGHEPHEREHRISRSEEKMEKVDMCKNDA